MASKFKGTFTSLNPESKIFKELQIKQPDWWCLLRADKELYIHLRKDNYINVYYSGGSVAKINYNHDFTAVIHQKYLGYNKPRGKTKKNTDSFEYDILDLTELNEYIIADIKNNIENEYLHVKDRENPAEKWIQGEMIIGNPNYIDSEFQFNQDKVIGNLRIDLIELSGSVLSFVELKGISDNRLRNDEKRNSNIPEIIEQMEKYRMFINNYEEDINLYYKNIIKIKHNLGLFISDSTDFTINKTPKLVIADTYKRITKGREERISDIKKLLEKNNIDYVITKCEL